VRHSGAARTVGGLLSARALEAVTLIGAGHPVRLLAEPEFDRGAIGEQRLLDRLATWKAAGARPGRYDLEVALLRLVPRASEEIWSGWQRLQPATAGSARRNYLAAQQQLTFASVVGVPRDTLSRQFFDLEVLARATGSVQTDSQAWNLVTALGDPLRDYAAIYSERGHQALRRYC